ncbi:vacuolar protein sorting-associated protein 74 [Trichomonascus vanleenenianus]|uniref:Vps74p n=1 Tax=Trichomonascus vanleenenianus TaxID=2268995 RepID=UPI003ECA14CF
MSTLQRRRVGGSTPSNEEPPVSPGFENGRRVAYDPEDIGSTVEDTKKNPRLTLMEEVLLLGLKDSQGYLSFWNDNISYALRGCILMELALRGKIAMVSDPGRRHRALSERVVEVIDEHITGEALLDETVKMMKTSEPLSVNTWIDYLSGETWNLTKISYQLKQVRERLAKGLVDKGILRTEKRNFFLFDMATHPVADSAAKDEIRRRVVTMLTARTIALPSTPFFPEGIPFRFLRSLALIGGAYAGTVLENVLTNLGYDARDQAFNRADELLNDYSQWPFESRGDRGGLGVNLASELASEITESNELQVEVVAAVLSVYTKLDGIF